MQHSKVQGMTEAARGVDTQNPSGALQLYKSMGHRTIKQNIAYRKPLDVEPANSKERPG